MEEVKKIIDQFSPSVIAPLLLEEQDADLRDEMKGKLLAYNDLISITKVYEAKGLGKLKGYLERFDPYAENLNLYVNLYDSRAERVIASKIKGLFTLKDKILEYLADTPIESNEDTDTPGVPGPDTGEAPKEEAPSAKPLQGEVSDGRKKRK